ncbi:MAG: VIT family protein [Acetobacteraceae bacterium]|nr:VIT family protein [Acetobacteraceae bacterium]
MRSFGHPERHVVARLGWLRAAVLGANDGLLSTASLIIGVASAQGTKSALLVAGLSGLVAGAMSMAAGEFVSVSSQTDSERADLAREGRELAADRAGELSELTAIYVRRGLEQPLAAQVAAQLMRHDALGAHARDELGISTTRGARPVQAALASAAAFSVGALCPILVALVLPEHLDAAGVCVASLILLAVLGAVGARIGGAEPQRAALRVTVWGVFAMAVTAVVGSVFGVRL